MSDRTDYRIPILIAIPLCFCLAWAAVDYGFFSGAEQHNDQNLPDIEIAFNSDGTPESDALLSVFQLHGIPVNAANSDLLQTISGIGPKLAEKIIAERERSGPFASAQELARVPGIGSKRISQFQEYLSFD